MAEHTANAMPRPPAPVGHSVKLGLDIYVEAAIRAKRRGLNVGQYVERAVKAGMVLDDRQWRVEQFQVAKREAERDNNQAMPYLPSLS